MPVFELTTIVYILDLSGLYSTPRTVIRILAIFAEEPCFTMQLVLLTVIYKGVILFSGFFPDSGYSVIWRFV